MHQDCSSTTIIPHTPPRKQRLKMTTRWFTAIVDFLPEVAYSSQGRRTSRCHRPQGIQRCPHRDTSEPLRDAPQRRTAPLAAMYAHLKNNIENTSVVMIMGFVAHRPALPSTGASCYTYAKKYTTSFKKHLQKRRGIVHAAGKTTTKALWQREEDH